MTFSGQDTRPRIEARVDPWFLEEVDEHCESRGLTRSEFLRAAVEQALPADEVVGLPRDPKLKETLFWLADRADERGQLPRYYLPELAQHLGIKKDMVKWSRMKPLERQGWISVDWGKVTIIKWPYEEAGK
jgi:hypothetical protein